jgi:hypothetical protein
MGRHFFKIARQRWGTGGEELPCGDRELGGGVLTVTAHDNGVAPRPALARPWWDQVGGACVCRTGEGKPLTGGAA